MISKKGYYTFGIVLIIAIVLILSLRGNTNTTSTDSTTGTTEATANAVSSGQDACAEAMFTCYKPCTSKSEADLGSCLASCSINTAKSAACSKFQFNTDAENTAFIAALNSANKVKWNCINGCEDSSLGLAACFKSCLN